MTIEQYEIKAGDLAKNYVDKGEKGVSGFDGLLDIRPAYQREFIYGEKERNAVILSMASGFPLGVFYWTDNGRSSLKYELLDGQQRTISICQFINNEFTVEFEKGTPKYFRNIEDTELGKKILDYKLFVYICKDGDKEEQLNWFRTINIAGVKLTEQELLNAAYTGSWLEDAKSFFSKTNCPAYTSGKKFLKGSPIRQDYLETVLDWISEGNIAGYMAEHQNDNDATELKNYFISVIDWVHDLFPKSFYRKEMLGLDWGRLHRLYHEKKYDIVSLNKRIDELMANEEVTDKKGIYEYVLSGEDESIARKLSKRTFSETDKRTVYEKQGGICPLCNEHHEYEEMEGDHTVPWWRGGKTTIDNLQMLCRKCNSGKAGKMKI